MAKANADGKTCVICGTSYFGGRQVTCSEICRVELVNCLISGKFKIVVRASTGEAFVVPTKDIIEKGIRGQDLDRYPKCGNAQ